MNQLVLKELEKYIDKKKSVDLARFFKTGKGEYGEGDKFLGITVPNIRKVVKEFRTLSLDELKEFLYSEYHEHRMFAVLVLTCQYESKRLQISQTKEEIYNFYLEHRKQINNWDLIDVTCPHIIGAHLYDKDRAILYEFANSSNLWEKRISIISTFAFIKKNQFDDTLAIADILLDDKHDLIHKAVGWAIRNVGIKDESRMIEFLKARYKSMPRTMLRYAIEKLDEDLRQKFLKGYI